MAHILLRKIKIWGTKKRRLIDYIHIFVTDQFLTRVTSQGVGFWGIRTVGARVYISELTYLNYCNRWPFSAKLATNVTPLKDPTKLYFLIFYFSNNTDVHNCDYFVSGEA